MKAFNLFLAPLLRTTISTAIACTIFKSSSPKRRFIVVKKSSYMLVPISKTSRLLTALLLATAAMAIQAGSVTGSWDWNGSSKAGHWLKTIQSGSKVRFQLEISRGAPSYNSGFIEGEFELQGNSGVFSSVGVFSLAKDGVCEITFIFQPKKVLLSEPPGKNDCGFGYGVNADRELTLRSRKKPNLSNGDPR